MDEMRHETEKEIEQQIAREIEKRVEKGVERGVTIAIQVAVTFVIAVIVFKFVWAWVIPDLFPGAVAQGLIAANLSWIAALKLGVLVAVLGGFPPTLDQAIKSRQ
jgi:hypothetical protein